MRTIAEQYGIPVRTLQCRAVKECWTIARADYVRSQNEYEASPAPEQPKTYVSTMSDTDHGERIAWLQARMGRLQDLLEIETKPDHIKKLTDAYSKHFEQWRVLSNIPLPGSRRPSRKQERRAFHILPEPIPVVDPAP
jgi:hypothetical protein